MPEAYLISYFLKKEIVKYILTLIVMLNPLVRQLTEHFPFNKFTFNSTIGSEEWKYRYLIASIICGGNRELDTVNACNTIFDKFPTKEDIVNLENRNTIISTLEQNNIKYAGKKYNYIQSTSEALVNKNIPDSLEELTKLNGVGKHTAQVILATCFNQNEFAVDLHVKRLFERLGYSTTDKQIDILTKDILDKGPLSRAIVSFGQNICTFNPNCGSCLLSKDCKFTNNSLLEKHATKLNIADNTYHVDNETQVFINGYGKCSCKVNNRFKCNHIKQLEQNTSEGIQ